MVKAQNGAEQGAQTKALQDVDVLVVGAGMVGSAAAIGLSQQGYQVCVIDAADLSQGDTRYSPSFDERSTALSYGSRYILQDLGVWQALAPYVEPVRRIHVSEKARMGVTRMQATDHGLEALGYIAPNKAIGQAMLERLAALDITLLSCTSITAVAAKSSGYGVTLSSGEELQCRLLLVVDGAKSSTAKLLGVDFRRQPYQQHALITNVETASPHEGEAFERFCTEGPMALLPLQGQRMALAWTLPDELVQDYLTMPDADFLSALNERFGGRLGGFVRVGERQSYPLVLSRACEQYRSHLMLLGNAAHSLHPVAGQGFNLALRGLSALLEATQEGNRDDLGKLNQLAQAAAAHEADLKLTVSASDALVRGFSNDNLGLTLLRDLGLVGLNNAPALKRRFVEQAMGLAGRRFNLHTNNI